MDVALAKLPEENFVQPYINVDGVKPVIRGQYINTAALLQTLQSTSTDPGLSVNDIYGNIHNILHYVDRNDPLGPYPSNPANDPQYRNWEYSVQNWKNAQFGAFLNLSTSSSTDDEVTDPEPAEEESSRRNRDD